MYPPNTRKSRKAYITGIEYDFYPDFICQKPKLKWNLTKYDFLKTQENNLNWCIPTVRNTPTSGPRNSGTLRFETPNLLSSTPRFLPSLYPHPILWEEMPNTRNNLIGYWNRPTTSILVPNIGILWKVPKQNPDQAAHFLPSSSPHHLRQHSQSVTAELIFVGVTTTQTHLLLRSDPTPTLFSSSSFIYSAPDTWDTLPPSPTIVSEFPDVVSAHPLDILPHVAPEPFSLESLMRSWPYSSHHFTEFRPYQVDTDDRKLRLTAHPHMTHTHALKHETFCLEHICPTHYPYGGNKWAK